MRRTDRYPTRSLMIVLVVLQSRWSHLGGDRVAPDFLLLRCSSTRSAQNRERAARICSRCCAR